MSKEFIYSKVLIKYLEDLNGNYYSTSKCRQKTLETVYSVSRNRNLDREVLTECLLRSKKLWNLEILWFFRYFNLIECLEYLRIKVANPCNCEELVESFVYLFYHSETTQEVAQDYMGVVSEFFHREREISRPFKNDLCNSLLKEIHLNLPERFCTIVKDTVRGTKNVSRVPKLLETLCDFSFKEEAQDILCCLKLGLPEFPLQVSEKLAMFYQTVIQVSQPDVIRDYLSGFISKHTGNWKRVMFFISESIRMKELNVKPLIQSLIDRSLDELDENLLFTGLLLARIVCLHSSVSSDKVTYMSWFSSTFSSSSKRPLHSNKRAQFCLKALTKIVSVDAPCYTRAHIHCAVSVPSSCHLDLSEYLQTAKSYLSSIQETTEVGMFHEDNGENDVDHLVTHFRNTNKIPANFLANVNFRRHYYEREFLRKLCTSCQGPSSIHHKIIQKLESLGKIPGSVFRKHVEECK